MNKPPPLNRAYYRDLNIKAFKRRGFINHRSTLGLRLARRERGTDRAAALTPEWCLRWASKSSMTSASEQIVIPVFWGDQIMY